jgi:hypothetical protein
MIDNYPDDENGRALHNMAVSGDDMSKARDIDFSVVFSSGGAAKKFCEEISNLQVKVECFNSDERPGVWDVTVTTFVLPTHEAITAYECLLSAIASPLGGRNDGWGSFSVPLN